MARVRITDWEITEEQWKKGKEAFEAYKNMADDAKRRIYLEEETIIIEGAYKYGVSLNRCRDMLDICRWIFHLQSKPWMNEVMLRRFAKVACEANGFGDADLMPWRD